MSARFIAVKPDSENKAERWWAELDERFPAFASSLRRNDGAVIEESLWSPLAALPGFEEGPEYAPTALIDYGGWGDGYLEVVGGAQSCFERLY